MSQSYLGSLAFEPNLNRLNVLKKKKRRKKKVRKKRGKTDINGKIPFGFSVSLAPCKSSLPSVVSSYRPTMRLPQEVPLFLSFGT